MGLKGNSIEIQRKLSKSLLNALPCIGVLRRTLKIDEVAVCAFTIEMHNMGKMYYGEIPFQQKNL